MGLHSWLVIASTFLVLGVAIFEAIVFLVNSIDEMNEESGGGEQ